MSDTSPINAAGLGELAGAGEDSLNPQELEEMRRLWDALDDADTPMSPDMTLEPPRAIGDDLKASRQAQRRLPIAIGIMAAFVVGSAFALGVREDGQHMAIQLIAVGMMAVGVLSLLAGVRLGGLKQKIGVGLLLTGAAAYLGFTGMQLMSEPVNANVQWYEIACLKASVLWAAPGAVLMVWSLWGAKLPTPLTGGLLGMGVGFFSATFLHLHCPVVHPLHLLMHHGGAIALMGLLGAGIAWMLLRRNLASPA